MTVYGQAPLLLSWNVQTLSFTDLGLHLGVQLTPRGWAKTEGVSLELYASNAGRVRPAFDWLNAWGVARSAGVAPMARLALRSAGAEFESAQTEVFAAGGGLAAGRGAG